MLKDRLEVLLRDVLDRAEDELDSFEIECVIGQTKTWYLKYHRLLLKKSRRPIFALWSLSLGTSTCIFRGLPKFLEHYGKCVLEGSRDAARRHGLRTAVATTHYLREELIFSNQKLRCSRIAHLLSAGSLGRRKISQDLINAFDATFGGAGEINPISDFVLCNVWERAANPDLEKMLVLFRKCWSSGIYHLRIQATEMFSMQVYWLTERAGDHLPTLVQELESRLGKNPFLNTILFDLLSRLGSLEPPVSIQAADEEVQGLLTELREGSGVSALLHIYYYLGQMEFTSPINYRPEATSPQNVKRLMEIGLENFDRIDFGDLRIGFSDPFALLCQVLEKVGDEQTVRLLESFTADQQKGPVVIRTIRTIKLRLRST